MSNMFKNIFKNKGKEAEKPEDKKATSPSISTTGKDTLETKPFEINLNDMWKYDNDELIDFIHKYENYTKSILSKYNEMAQEQNVIREKMNLLEKERRRLIQEAEQQKIYIENLKQSLNEQSLSEQSSSPLKLSTSASISQAEKRQIEDMIKQKIRIKGIDANLLDELRLTGDKIVSQLMDVKNMMELKGENDQPSNQENDVKNKEDQAQIGEEKHENNQNKNEQEKDENNENKEDTRENKAQEKNDKVLKIEVDETLRNNFMQLVDDVEMTLQLILPKFLEINDKIKQREKEIIELLKGDLLDSLRQLEEGQAERYSSEQVQELESKINETRSKLIKIESTLTETRAELSSKNEQLEKAKKINEGLQEQLKTNQQLLNEQIEASKKEIDHLNSSINHLQVQLSKAESEVLAKKEEKYSVENEAEKAKEDLKILQEAKSRSQEEVNSKMQGLQDVINTLTGEKEKLSQKISQLELDKTDIENKLIQEKLKHHQTMSDLQKVKETLTESQKDLNEEIENRKSDIKKIEELKRQYVECERKAKEYKKSMKNLSHQVLDLQNKIHNDNKEREKERQLTVTQTSDPKSLERLEFETLQTTDELTEKTQLINELYQKINEIKESLDKALNESSQLNKENKTLKDKQEELNTQVKVLHEKREKGLQEIARLAAIIDEIKAKNPSINIPQQRTVVPQFSQRSPVPGSPDDVKSSSTKSLQHTSPLISKDRFSLNKGHASSYLKGIKTNLNQLYNEVLVAITTDKAQETDRLPRTASRLDSSMMLNESISENLLRIEKKVNDVMMLLHEYLEAIEG